LVRTKRTEIVKNRHVKPALNFVCGHGSLGLRDLPDPLAGYKGPLRGGEGKAEWKGGGKQNENVMWGKGGKRKEWGGKGGDGLSPGPLQAGRTRNLSVTSPSPILYH